MTHVTTKWRPIFDRGGYFCLVPDPSAGKTRRVLERWCEVAHAASYMFNLKPIPPKDWHITIASPYELELLNKNYVTFDTGIREICFDFKDLEDLQLFRDRDKKNIPYFHTTPDAMLASDTRGNLSFCTSFSQNSNALEVVTRMRDLCGLDSPFDPHLTLCNRTGNIKDSVGFRHRSIELTGKEAKLGFIDFDSFTKSSNPLGLNQLFRQMRGRLADQYSYTNYGGLYEIEGWPERDNTKW